jgi:TonB-dependent starch-binding outer membrane protein SusC
MSNFFTKKTIFKIMKISLVQLMLITLVVSVSYAHRSYGQESLKERATISIKNGSLKSVLQAIEKQVDVTFSYQKEVLNTTDKINIELKNETVAEILKKVLTPHNISYQVFRNNQIVLTKNVGLGNLESLKKEPINDVKSEEAIADITIKGTVTDESGEKLPGVSITVKGSTRGVTTNTSGEYSIAVSDDKAILVFSFVGYQAQEVIIGNRTNLNIALKVDNKALDEVVVVGYGTVKKSDLTGSVAKVGEANIKATPIVSLDRAMQGRAAGVLVTQNSARPGGSSTIRIRGTGSVNAGNEPLYVIDGFPTGNLNSINPTDIESIEILKDASATAIYGSRGSNGVVMVTTKRGKTGQSSIDYESYYGVQSVRKTIPLLNAQQYADFINEARVNGGGKAYFDGSSVSQPLPSSLGDGTNWQNEVFQNASIQNHQLSISGGETKTRYSISGSYYDQKGIILNSYFKRYTLKANLDREVTNHLKVGVSIQGAFTKSNSSRTETDGGGNSGVTNAALNFAPTFPILNNAGTYYRDLSTLNGNLVDNPVGLANEVTDEFMNTRLLSNLFADFKIIEGLNFRTSWGADLYNTKSNFYATRLIGLGAGTNGNAAISTGQFLNWLNENTLTYSKTIRDKHSIAALAGYTTQGYHNETLGASAINFNDDFASFNNLSAGATLQTPSSGANDWALISYLARINYGFSNRYLLTLTARKDGSSRFGPNNKFGFFPSGAVAWRLINEKFMERQKLFTDLKLRASYGLTGNQEIGDYRYLSSISVASYPFGGANAALKIGGVPNGISNLDLSWEKNAQFDAGIDVGLLNNRIQITTDYYIKTTSDLLFNVNVPQTTGFSTSLRNIGQVENKGLEIGINTVNIDKGDFQWNSEFNIAFNKNKILALDGRPEFTAGEGSGHLQVSNTILMKVGEPLGNFYGRKVGGVFQNQSEIDASTQKTAKPGDFRYVDLNADGIINDLDRTVIGNGNPKFFGGLNNTFTFKGVELNLFFQGSFGGDILNFGRFDLYNLNGNNNQSADVLNRWTPSNPSNEIPRATSTGGQRILSSFHIEDGSYLRLKNVSLGHNLPNSLLKKLSIRSAKVYVSAQNWLTFTNYKGYDPEVSRFGTSSISQGMDYGGYPAAKTILVGLNIKF